MIERQIPLLSSAAGLLITKEPSTSTAGVTAWRNYTGGHRPASPVSPRELTTG
jgi:hypothetical protein